MIVDGPYIFRQGKLGDFTARRQVDIPKGKPPMFVLEYNNQQIGVAHGSRCSIEHIEIQAEHDIGHGTKFIELWERWAKINCCTSIVISPVTVPELDHILEEKRNFSLIRDDDGAKTYRKELD